MSHRFRRRDVSSMPPPAARTSLGDHVEVSTQRIAWRETGNHLAAPQVPDRAAHRSDVSPVVLRQPWDSFRISRVWKNGGAAVLSMIARESKVAAGWAIVTRLAAGVPAARGAAAGLRVVRPDLRPCRAMRGATSRIQPPS